MCDTSECKRLVDETLKQLGGIDIVISNAVCLITPWGHNHVLKATGMDALQRLCRSGFYVRGRVGQGTLFCLVRYLSSIIFILTRSNSSSHTHMKPSS
jgi:NAD(P)-dependent dehydrogenase (short-subunit alcohol dehydrogenase family)